MIVKDHSALKLLSGVDYHIEPGESQMKQLKNSQIWFEFVINTHHRQKKYVLVFDHAP